MKGTRAPQRRPRCPMEMRRPLRQPLQRHRCHTPPARRHASWRGWSPAVPRGEGRAQSENGHEQRDTGSSRETPRRTTLTTKQR
eukprot:2021993-Alexandrium_andersonii.AAC.1